MMDWKLFLACFNGPNVFRKYYEVGGAIAAPQGEFPGGMYRTNFVEDHCGFVVRIVETCWTLAMYTSPLLVPYAAYRRSLLGMSPELALKFALGIAFVYGGAYLGRGLGRAINKDYTNFLCVLYGALQQNNTENVGVGNVNMRNLRKYDFDFRYWPVNYRWRDTDISGEPVPKRRFLKDRTEDPAMVGRSFITKMFLDGLSYVAAHAVARRLMYPGTLALLQKAVAPALEQGRTKLVEQSNAQRFKLQTRTGIEIDTMFADRRNNPQFPKGNTLVITCEGNAGFYEVGSSSTPLEAHYSVLMWNHPGFGGSTGVPWPSEEAAAIDVVVQFALNQLGWNEGDILIYGWSIGGFTATWAAMNYRNVRALILDATFDDVVPLAKNTMPQSWSPLVVHTIRKYLNLHIREQLCQYDGPFVLIRRVRDEVMAAAADVPSDPASVRRANQANHLLKAVLTARYPNIFRQDDDDDVIGLSLVDQWLASTAEEQAVLFAVNDVDMAECRSLLQTLVLEHDNNAEDADGDAAIGAERFPLLIGAELDACDRRRLALYLASKHLVDYDSTHCTPLPADRFAEPTHPWE